MAQFPSEIAAHQVEMLFAGKAIFHENRMKTLKDFTGYDAPAGEDATLGLNLVQAERRVKEVEAVNAELRAQLSAAQSQPKGDEALDELTDLVEALIPDNKTGLDRLPMEALGKVAKYRGLSVEGKEKPEIVAALLKKEGE